MSLSLYNIEDSLQQLMELRTQAIEEGDAEAEKAIEHEIEAYLTKEAAKAASFAGVILARHDLIDNAKRAIERDKAILRQAEADVERLEGIALAVMQRFDVKEIKDERTGHGLKRQGNGGLQPLEITMPDILPEGLKQYTVKMAGDLYHWLWSVVTEWEKEHAVHPLAHRAFDEAPSTPRNQEIREALKRGESIPGAKLLDSGEHIRVL